MVGYSLMTNKSGLEFATLGRWCLGNKGEHAGSPLQYLLSVLTA